MVTHTLDGLSGIGSLCLAENGSTLHWLDAQNEPRRACLIVPPNVTRAAPLPLLVWLHPSLAPQDSVALTGVLEQLTLADLSGDPARRGYLLLLPEGRDTEHYYPFPDDRGIGWDNWYRNFDRSSPGLNVDAASVDHFIAEAKATGLVDEKRVFLSGWSNGAAFAQLYALNTPGIAAAAVYSSPNPYGDATDPCPQAVFATNLTPLMDIHNACDIIGICQTGTKLHKDLAARFPRLRQRPVIIDERFREVPACKAQCANQTIVPGGLTPGTLNHLRWPLPWNAPLFQFLREHPLP
ncbi:MAG: hypothetical protein NVS9B10_25970 [Nevskia sp.]